MKKIRFLALLLVGVLLFSSFQVWKYYNTEKEETKQFDAVIELIELPPNENTNEPSVPDKESEVVWTVDEQYGELFNQNADMIGWISIPDTIINYPVMQTPDRPNFYLKHNFERQYSNYGVPYIAESCIINPQSDNITIFGHHMKSGKMFGNLDKYKSEKFFYEHSVIQFDTRAGFGEYQIFAVFKVNPYDFAYNQFDNAVDKEEFDNYVRRCKELSFYDTGITAEYGDKLITLSTCEYSGQNNRLVVVAKKIGGEPSG